MVILKTMFLNHILSCLPWLKGNIILLQFSFIVNEHTIYISANHYHVSFFFLNRFGGLSLLFNSILRFGALHNSRLS